MRVQKEIKQKFVDCGDREIECLMTLDLQNIEEILNIQCSTQVLLATSKESAEENFNNFFQIWESQQKIKNQISFRDKLNSTFSNTF